MVEKDFTSDCDAEDQQEAKNQKFQNACRIWFCPSEDRIARELRELPQEEREKVWADLSGNEKTSQFRKEVIEVPDDISKAIDDMKQELEKTKDKQAFELAQHQAPDYVNGRSFHLMFLRSCEYDGKKAAQKMVEHMETKKRLFGNEVLGREVKLSDLSPEDMDVLKSGWIQLLPERDNAGRMVLFGHVESLKFKERDNVSRALFYCLMSALQDDESVQKLGIVVVWNIMSEYSGGYDYEADRMAIKTACVVPVRPVARYIIFQCVLWNQVIEVLNHFITPQLRARTRSIYGSYSEVMYSLMCLGIPLKAIPTNEDGVMMFGNVKRWIAERVKKESKDRLIEGESAADGSARKRRRLRK